MSVCPMPTSLLNLVLFAGASLGNVVLMVSSHNWWYGGTLSKTAGKVMHLVHGLLALAGPAAFFYFFGTAPGYLPPPDDPALLPLAVYQAVCVPFGLVVFPAVTLYRLLRPRPAALLGNHTQPLDVAERLGRKPAGRGRRALLARLPYNEVFRVDLSERTLCLKRLPRAWDGLSVLHLSDLHFNGTPDRDFHAHLMDACAAWEPDLVCLTGDVVDSEEHHRWVVPVLGRLRWRVAAFAVLGNHDHWFDVERIRRRLRRLGMTVLVNDWVRAEVRGQPLVVVGHEGPWLAPAPDLGDCPPAPFRLCLSHTPDNIAWARRHHIDLMLSGHVHGGQVRLPAVGSLLVPSRFGRRYDCGTFDEPPTLLHVSRGVAGEHPLRYHCKPEVTKLILRAPGAADA